MLKLMMAVFPFALTISAPVDAQAPDGYETIYDAPTRVNLGGRPVIAEIAFHTDRRAAQDGDLRLALTTDVTKFVTETEQDLENWIARRRADCGERWKSGEPDISFPENAIRFTIYLEIEYWTCGWNGKGRPGRLAQETGSVDVTLIPFVADGKLQARLGSFKIEERTGVSRYLPLEFIVKRALEQELANLNENPKFYRAPQPLLSEGFAYQSIEANEDEDGRVVITARYRAQGSSTAFNRITAKLTSEGITQ